MGIAAAPSAQIQRCTFGADITHINLQNKNKIRTTQKRRRKNRQKAKKMFTTGLELAIASLANFHEAWSALGPLFVHSALQVDAQFFQNRGVRTHNAKLGNSKWE